MDFETVLKGERNLPLVTVFFLLIGNSSRTTYKLKKHFVTMVARPGNEIIATQTAQARSGQEVPTFLLTR